ncbi:MAG: peptidase S41 [Phycisphaera sp.]|nr:peptidase S41 [Phycisphaera sp.]
MKFKLLAAILLVATGTSAAAASEGNVDLPRFPSISPDGATVVFSWRGDLWKVPFDGGQAVRLTSHPGREHDSYWTPDGSEIVFESDRDGVVNIWAMKPDGSGIRRITDLDTSAGLSGVGIDGKGETKVSFSAYLEGDLHRAPRPFEVSIQGGEPTRVHDAFGSRAVRSPDGRRTVFERGNVRPQRRHYRGADRRDVWLHDESLETFRKLTDWDGNDMTARWAGDDAVLFLSDREGNTHNIQRMDLADGETSPLTSFEEIDVASFDATPSGNRLVLHRWDTLYGLDLSEEDPVPRPIRLSAPEDSLDEIEILDISNRVTEAAMNPDGGSIAVIAYGEVLVRSTDDGSSTRRITSTHGRETGIAWSPDGTTLYFTEVSEGRRRIMAATVSTTREELRTSYTDRTEPKEDATPEADAEVSDPATPEDSAVGTSDPVSGTWEAVFDHANGSEYPFTLEIELAAEGAVTGTLSSEMFEGSVNGSFDPDAGSLVLSFASDTEGIPGATLELVVDGDRVSGTVVLDDGGRGTLAGSRMPATDDEKVATPEEADVEDDAAESKKDDDEEETEADPLLDPARWADALRFDIKPMIETEAGPQRPTPSPDGMSLAFLDGRGDLFIRDLATDVDRLLRAGWDSGIDFRWSQDSRWMVFAQSDLDFNRDVFIVPADGGASPVNITRHPDNDGSPCLSADGRILAFASERNDEEYDPYVVFLDRSLEALAEPELDDYFEKQAKAAKARKALDPDKLRERLAARRAGEDEEDEKDVDPPFSTEDLETAYLRLRQVTNLPGNSSSVEILPAGDTILFNYSTGAPSASGLHSIDWDGGGRKRLGDTVEMQGLDLSGGRLVAVGGGRAKTISIPGGKAKSYPVSQKIRIDLETQSSEKFLEAAAIMGEYFYHPDMKGLDWPALTERYHEMARRTRTADEFNWVGNRLLGELSSSHQGIRASAERMDLRESIGRLGIRVEPVADGYRIVRIIPGGPAESSDTPLQVGDEIIGIEFESLDLDASPRETIGSRLRGRIGDETVVTVRRATDDGEPMEIDLLLEPISRGAETMLVYRDTQRRRADLVSEWSDGRLGYAHIRGMSQPSLDEFERDLFAAADGRDGLLIDVRDNGGGWTTDRLLASIMTAPHAYTVPRGADPNETDGYPQDRLFIQRYALPINMLCNEKSYSNAEIISHAFKTFGRGTLVGQQTHGSVISTGGTSLIDGTTIRLPFRGWYLPDGSDMENNGAMPDIVVEQTPESESADEDLQLKAAVDDLLRRIDAEKP